MELKCRINGIDYLNVSQGESFSDEFNETLDSGSLIISHQEYIENLKPHDDVFIWDSSYDFEGFNYDKLYMKKDGISYIFVYNPNTMEFEYTKDNSTITVYYKHQLVENYSETMINLRDLTQKGKGVGQYKPIYEYKIQLMSETKNLEVVQLPNISVTEPLNQAKKISIWEYLNRYINLYSPVYKKVDDKILKTWKFEKKYKLSDSLKIIFDNAYSPDFSLDSPNLKDVLSKLMIAKDYIPYLKNNVIYAMDITSRRGTFSQLDKVNYISNNMSSVDFCDNLKKTYSNALSKDNTARSIEYIGFRNSNNLLMTLNNMQLETRFPIYKINAIYMCYYKKIKVDNQTKIFLCKQDITELVKLNTERNVLIQDWDELNKENPTIPADMAKYKMCTVGYDIGSKIISGWGTQYTYPKVGTFWDITKTYIQNIFEKMDIAYPYGIYGVGYVKNKIGGQGNYEYDTINPLNNIALSNNFTGGSDPLKLKSFIFEIDYQGFYNGTVIHSKDSGLDNITINDNPSSSLTILEQDGLFTKEKVNRFGNKAVKINARYDDISQLQPLGSVFHDFESGDDDIIIYHREYQIWDKEIIAVYYGIHDYVLKNYYTSVYAKHRTWNLIPYSESVRRAENRKSILLLSKDKCFFEKFDQDTLNQKFLLKQFNGNPLSYIISCFKSNEITENVRLIDKPEKLNYAYIKYFDYDVLGNQLSEKYYLSDLNSFVSGNSLCLNTSMPDNISGGNYISKFRPSFNTFKKDSKPKMSDDIVNYILQTNVEDDYTGSLQSWGKSSDDYGFAPKLGFYLSHSDNDYFSEILTNETDVDNLYYGDFLKFPYIENIQKYNSKNIIGNDFEICKDNKEIIDMTYQIEPITNESDVAFSSWFMQLSDLITVYDKIDSESSYKNSRGVSGSFEMYGGVYYLAYSSGSLDRLDTEAKCRPYIVFRINKNVFNTIKYATDYINNFIDVEDFDIIYRLNQKLKESDYARDITAYSFKVTQIKCEYNSNTGNAILKIKTRENYQIGTGSSSSDLGLTVRELQLSNVENFILETKMNNTTFDNNETYFYFIFEEERLKTNNNVIVNYRAFASDIDWSNDSNSIYYNDDKTASSKIINNLYSASLSVSDLLRDKCVPKTGSFIISNIQDDFFKFKKNMFVFTSNNSLYKEIVYDKYGYANNYDFQYAIYNINDIIMYNNEVYICKENIKIPENFDANKWQKISNAVVNGNLYKITNDKSFWNNKDFTITNLLPKNVFTVEKQNGLNYIKANLNDLTTKPKSIQYWFENKGTINFVFGVNVSEEEWNQKIVKIYISNLTNRDLKIFNDKNMVIDEKVLNLIGKENYNIPDGQFYDIPTIPEYSITVPYPAVGYSLTITRLKSPYGGKPENTIIQPTDTIYVQDVLKFDISFDNLKYSLGSFTINNQPFNSGDSITIENDINLNIEMMPVPYILSLVVPQTGLQSYNVKRITSPIGNASTNVELSNGDTIYYDDTLYLYTTANVGYNDLTYVNNEIFIGYPDYIWTVTGNTSVELEANPIKTSLNISAGTFMGAANIRRTSSPIFNQSIGNLINGSEIYYGDVIVLGWELDNEYEIVTHTYNGNTFEQNQQITYQGGEFNIVLTSKIASSWQEVWAGSYIWTADTLAGERIENDVAVIGLTANIPTRVTAKFTWKEGTEENFAWVTDSQTCCGLSYELGIYSTWENQGNGFPTTSLPMYLGINTPTQEGYLNMYAYGSTVNNVKRTAYSIEITKIEQYY